MIFKCYTTLNAPKIIEIEKNNVFKAKDWGRVWNVKSCCEMLKLQKNKQGSLAVHTVIHL